MSRESVLAAGRVLALGRVGFGVALLAAPGVVGRPWIGEVAGTPNGRVALRALGVRDLLLGGIAAHVIDRGPVAARAAQANAIADLVDFTATLAALRSLPPTAAGALAVAGGGAVAGLLVSRLLAASPAL
jgi:hypothetical protein